MKASLNSPPDFVLQTSTTLSLNCQKLSQVFLTEVKTTTLQQLMCILNYFNQQVQNRLNMVYSQCGESIHCHNTPMRSQKVDQVKVECAYVPKRKDNSPTFVNAYWMKMTASERNNSFKMNPQLIDYVRVKAKNHKICIPAPTVDAFADQWNRQCKFFCSKEQNFVDRKWDKEKWTDEFVWMNPPFSVAMFDELIGAIKRRKLHCLVAVSLAPKFCNCRIQLQKLACYSVSFLPFYGMFLGAKSLYTTPLDKPKYGVHLFYIKLT